MIPATQAAGYADILSRLPACDAVVVAYFTAHPGADRNDLDHDVGKGRPNYQGSRRIAKLERAGVLCHVARPGSRCRGYYSTGQPPRFVPKAIPAKRQLAALCAELHAIAEGQLLVAGQAVLAVARRFEQTTPANGNAEGDK
jgi:hypothetical protein